VKKQIKEIIYAVKSFTISTLHQQAILLRAVTRRKRRVINCALRKQEVNIKY
jgi:hypothetical protein